MFRIPRHIQLPFTDSYLWLSPRWEEMSGLRQFGLIFGVCFVPIILVVMLYRYELKLISRVFALGLLGLRLLVLFVLLFLVCLQPMVARTSSEELPGRVMVAVDRSDSMRVADPQRPALEKLRLALGLKLAGDLCSDAQLTSWIRDYETEGQPRWVKADESAGDAGRREALILERKQLHDKVCTRVDEQSRAALTQRILAADGVDLLKVLATNNQVDLMGFGRETWDADPEKLAELFKTLTSKENDKDAKGPDIGAASRTDLLGPLTRSLERSGPDSGRILGVVILSDGQHNGQESPVPKAVELGEKSLPIYAVGLGTRVPPPDIAVVGIKAPTAVFKDSDVPVEARFRVTGLAPQDLVLELRMSGQDKPIERRVIKHDGQKAAYVEKLQAHLDKTGTHTLTVSVHPASPETKEIRTDNNSQAVKINVGDDKAKVLIVDGEARWEYHYLASALSRDRNIQVTSVVFQQPRVGRIAEDDLVRIGNPLLNMPAEPDALAEYDCIVLGDVSPEQLPAADRERIRKYVADRGGTLVLVAGKRAMPLGYQANGDDALVKMLPIEQPHLVQADKERGFGVTLTQEGILADYMQMEEEAIQSQERWRKLPKHFWGIVGKVKPGAVSLAYWKSDVFQGKPGDEEKEQSLIARHNYGFGRVLFVGLDSTWRWRFRVGDTYHHRFWGQVIRWAATDKPLVTGNQWLRFGTREPVYQQGEEVEIVVRLNEETPKLRPDALAGARILRRDPVTKKEEAVALAPLTPRPAQPRVLQGKIRDLQAGEYLIELAIPDLGDKLRGPSGADGVAKPLQATFTVNATTTEEMADLASNWPLLEELANKSGGKFFTADQANDLVELLKSKNASHSEHTENRLWQWWPTLVLLLVLLTMEWIGRKLAGLP